jgi:hypothetical protein
MLYSGEPLRQPMGPLQVVWFKRDLLSSKTFCSKGF